MTQNITEIRVFISCPSDVEDEKNIVVQVCDSLSRMLKNRKIGIKSIHWKKDIVPKITGDGGQKIIDEQLIESDYDIYIGILWKKFGQPMDNGLTPTESEFEDAFKLYKKENKPLITFFFKKKEFLPYSQYELEQYSKVLQFSDRIQKLGLYKSFTDEIEFQRTVYEALNAFIEKLIILEEDKIIIERIQYIKVENYLNRKVCPINEYRSESFYLIHDKSKFDTIELIEKENRIVIVGDAGMGKTYELQRIASHFSNDREKFFPIYIQLNKFVNQNIDDFLPNRWNKVPANQLLIILDGLDEIESKNRKDAIRKIELFSDQQAASTIIISCRSNFYQAGSEKSLGTLKDFQTFILLPLEYSQIESFLKSTLIAKTDEFLDNILINQLNDLLLIPFYLVQLINLYKETNKLPETKAELFEKLILSRIELDESHFRTTIELEDFRERIIEIVEKIALGAEILGRNYFTDNEFMVIAPDLETRTLIKYCTAFKKTEGELVTWKFEHNNIQEYFAAKILSRLSFEVIKDFISFKPEFQKIVPSWINTVSFLLSISNDQNLLDWILEIEPEIAVKFEPDKIEKAIRIDIFKNIFNYYKEKQIWIERDRYTYHELARFAQSNEILEFLLTEIEKAKHCTTLSNAIKILSYMQMPNKFRNRGLSILLNTALDNFDFKISEHLQQDALIALSNLEFDSEDVLDEITSKLQDSENEWIRYGLYYLIHNSEFLDKYLDIFLDGIKFVRFEINSLESSHSRLFNERSELVTGLKKAISPDSIIKVLDYFICNRQDIHELFMGNHDIKFIAENAAKAFENDDRILRKAIDFSLEMIKAHLEDEQDQFLTFFKITNTKFAAFKNVLIIDSHSKEELLAYLTDDECIEFFLGEYEQQHIDDDDVLRFLHTLRWRNRDYFQKFYDLINERFNNKFKLAPELDWNKIREERSQRDFNLLFEKDDFIAETKQIFNNENKQYFSSKELLHLRTNNWPELYFSDLASDTLRRIAGSNQVSLQQAVDTINAYDWEWFAISHIYGKLQDNEKIKVTEKQISWISQWCYSNLDKVDFKTAVRKTGKSTYSVRYDAIYMQFFLRKFDFIYPKGVLLDMLSFHHRGKGIDYLESYLDKKDIVERILENLDTGIEPDDVLKNHLEFCLKNRIIDSIQFALKEIKNCSRSSEIRRVSLKIVVELSDDLSELENILADVKDEFRWEIIDELSKGDSTRVVDYLNDLLLNGVDENRIKASEYLIRLQDVRALKHYVKWIKDKNEFESHMYDSSTLTYLKNPDAIPVLIEFLELTYNESFNQPDLFDKPDRLIQGALQSIALESDDNYLKVKKAVSDFIERLKNIYQDVKWLYAFLSQLEQQYYVNKSEKVNINDVKRKLESIGL